MITGQSFRFEMRDKGRNARWVHTELHPAQSTRWPIDHPLSTGRASTRLDRLTALLVEGTTSLVTSLQSIFVVTFARHVTSKSQVPPGDDHKVASVALATRARLQHRR